MTSTCVTRFSGTLRQVIFVSKPYTYEVSLLVTDTNLVSFKPNSTMHKVHHMLLFSCVVPGSFDEIWDCGEMSGTFAEGRYSTAPVCSADYPMNMQIIYGWARDSPALKLPDGVGFKVGKDTAMRYLVLQVHYMHPLQDTFDIECVIEEDLKLHPFAFRVHAHDRGRVVSGFRVRRKIFYNGDWRDEWELIGKRNPKDPQMFYPVHNLNMVIEQDDAVAARCVMENKESRPISIGSTGEDEMCNFYLMYWVDGDQTLTKNMCASHGPPLSYWNFRSIPEKEANTLK
ncbi:unnamed protein product [Soboliphyme baturini]|uniref:Cu2_monoox_C domain-containing protein n=1 Tax=Soboliphyme baturini TaxID=241478 RepID=A0A183IE58_9BILA|nr:unnamed protein product [Soboliphyme baturini]